MPQGWTPVAEPDRSQWGNRADGSAKGDGFLGVLQRPDGKVSSEISIGVNIDGKEIEIPTLVPTLSAQEKNWLLTNDVSDPSRIPRTIQDKAVAFARTRIAAGQSPFAQAGESPSAAPVAGWAPVAAAPAAAPVSLADQLKGVQQSEQERTQSGRDVLKGVGQSVLGTIEGAGQIIRSALGMKPSTADPLSIPAPSATPQNASQQLGKTAGNIAQFFAPAGALGKAKAALATGHGILDALIGAGLEGASAAGVSSAQKGTTDDAGKTAAWTAGTGVAMQGAMSVAGTLGRKVEGWLVNASKADRQNGFQVGNIYKYKLGGTLSQSYDKANAAIEDLSHQLQSAVSGAKAGQTPSVDVLGELANTAKDLQKRSAETFGSNQEINKAVDKLLNDPLFQTLAPQGTVDLATAHKVKQAVGDLGAWLHDPSGRVMRDPESKGLEVVANALYSRLNTAIADKAVGPYRDINKQLSEILPIRQAIIRRLPVEQRQAVLSLTDLLSFSSGTWGLSLAGRMLKSGRAANALVNLSEQGAPLTNAVSRGSGAALSQQMK